MGNEKKQSAGEEGSRLLPCSFTPLWSQEEEGEAADGPESNAAAGQSEVGVDCL